MRGERKREKREGENERERICTLNPTRTQLVNINYLTNFEELCGTPDAGPKCFTASRALRGPRERDGQRRDEQSI